MPSKNSNGGANVNSSGGVVFQKSLLDTIAERSSYIIFEAKSVGLFNFASSKITICPNRITIVYGSLMNKVEYPLPIENVIGARINRGFLFSSLTIETFGYQKPEPLEYLSTRDARLARRYILALVECKKNNVDFNEYSLDELRKKLSAIGTVRYDSYSKHKL